MLTLNEKTKNKLAINNFSIKLDIESAENGGKYKTQGIWQRLANFFFQNQPGLLLVSGLGFALGLCLELKLLVIHNPSFTLNGQCVPTQTLYIRFQPPPCLIMPLILIVQSYWQSQARLMFVTALEMATAQK